MKVILDSTDDLSGQILALRAALPLMMNAKKGHLVGHVLPDGRGFSIYKNKNSIRVIASGPRQARLPLDEDDEGSD